MLFRSVLATVIAFSWNATPDDAPWYIKRMDFGRPSAQHRVAAWKAGVEMVRDHPFGFGWNKAVENYEKDYFPPENGGSAIIMNSYLILGVELGLLGLLCFVMYIGLCFWQGSRARSSPRSTNSIARSGEILAASANDMSVQCSACLSAALVFVVAFWFDGGLFDLPTATTFWILLELGAGQK